MIGRAVGLAESTVRTIWANREKIEKMKKCYGAAPLDKRSRAHDPAMVLMERYLAEHIRRKIEEGVAIDGRYIREKGKSFMPQPARELRLQIPTSELQRGGCRNF